MSKGYAVKIFQRISDADAGSVFLNSDFTDIADPETVRRNLNRLVGAGELRRIINGVYEKPAYSEFLKEAIAVSPDDVAKAVARNYHWTIAPCGNTALNLLGLSSQVPAVWPTSATARTEPINGMAGRLSSGTGPTGKFPAFLTCLRLSFRH